jgi:hypothetical protein
MTGRQGDKEKFSRGRISLAGDKVTTLLVILVNLLVSLYFITSAVVVINAFVWLPTFPDFWYDIQHIIYWPWQPYFDLAYALLGRSSISYGAYALLTRAPFLVVSLAIMGLAVRRLVRRPADAMCP